MASKELFFTPVIFAEGGHIENEASSGTGNNLPKLVLASGGTSSNYSLVAESKGLGSFQLRSTSYPKNQPGFVGVDLQIYASAPTETASGLFSCTVGSANTASGQNATAIGGGCIANATQSTAIGTSATASGNGATAVGNACSAGAANSLALGKHSSARIQGMTSFASGQASAVGDRQSGRLHLRGATTSNETISLTVDGSALSASNSLTLSEGLTLGGIATFIGVSSAGRRYMRRRFMAYRSSGGNATIDMNSNEAQNASLILPDVSSSVAANTTYQCADFQVTGQTGVAVDWLVMVDWVEMQS
jgi:hypothetical protein